jgi:hypothetical protein
VKGIQVCTNKGANPLQRGDNNKNAKIGWDYLKILFSRTIGPEKYRFTRELSDIVQIKIC